MMAGILFVIMLCFLNVVKSQILCESGFCRTYGFEVGCTTTSQNCRINNGTHSGLWLPSPTICNCCEYCLPFIVEGGPCSRGGPGTGTTVGRCGPGLTCTQEDDGNYCRRMESDCHAAQDGYDLRHATGTIGVLEQRPLCDGKGKFDTFHCVPTQTCFCQSEEGKRIFGEVPHLGAQTEQNMQCGCARLHDKIQTSIAPGVPLPVIGLRCTFDGNFNPVQCFNGVCYCVDKITGIIQEGESVELETAPITELSCYDPDLDLFPSQSLGEGPYNYTTPCLERIEEVIQLLRESEQDGYNVDFASGIPECLPDGTFGRVSKSSSGAKICVDARGRQIDGYEATPGTEAYNNMDCNCAQTSLLMETSIEKPVCCKNGNFRSIQCRRGFCRCVDQDGRQVGLESNNLADLTCYSGEDWRNC